MKNVTEQLLDRLLESLPPGPRRVLALVGILIVMVVAPVGYAAWAHWHAGTVAEENASLRQEVRHLEEKLAPFEAAAIKAFPGEEQTQAIAKLSEKVDSMASEISAKRKLDALVFAENCYTEVAWNSIALKQLDEASPTRLTISAPDASACTRLLDAPDLPAPLRTALVLYRPRIDDARRWHAKLTDACQRGGLSEANLAAAKDSAKDTLGLTETVKTEIRTFLLANSRRLPVVETLNADGRRRIEWGATLPGPTGSSQAP